MSLDAALSRAARAGALLVACDYDGTMAPIVGDPSLATPDSSALGALVRIAALARTHAAILSGRGLDELERLTGAPPGVALIGSHGVESSLEDRAGDLPARETLDEATVRFLELARRFDGAHVEEKPAGVAFHYRTVSPALQRQAAAQAEEIAAGYPDLRLLHGKRVVELAAGGVDKGAALAGLQQSTAADAIVFIGDDVTDEDAFAVLRPSDVGIKVGQGPTTASYRIDGQTLVARVLDDLFRTRASTLT